MSLSNPTATGRNLHPDEQRLVPVPSALTRARSNVWRELASWTLPRSVLFTHGDRHARHKRVALTFDDGPDAMTRRYLDALRDLDVRATFFLIGEQAEIQSGIAREYRHRGHEVGGHGWTHAPFSTMTSARLLDELRKTRSAIPVGLRRRPLVRPPRGMLTPRTLARLAAAGYATVLWSLDSDDCRTTDPHVVERRLRPENVATGDVVLLHEMQPWTLQALPRIVTGLRDAGYELVTVGELMAENEEAAR
jgi:peptidoglycan/xylan/chitin deacetylase (PgdA/CDA1 family)